MSKINTTFKEVAATHTHSAMIVVTIDNEELCTLLGILPNKQQQINIGLPYNLAVSEHIPVLNLLVDKLTMVAREYNTGTFNIKLHSFQIITQN